MSCEEHTRLSKVKHTHQLGDEGNDSEVLCIHISENTVVLNNADYCVIIPRPGHG